MLRWLHEPGGRPGPVTRLITVLVIVGLIGASSTAFWPALQWVLDLL